MAGIDPSYVPQPGDVFGVTGVGPVTVASAQPNNRCFFDTLGRGFDPMSIHVGIQSTPNVAAVASLAASGGNTGSGAIVGVSVVSPAVNPDPSGNGGPGGFGPYTILFTSTTAFSVKNAAGTVLQTGTYADPTNINVLGVTVKISGAPATDDSFVITPTGVTQA
jgi:hypothetical protein